MVVLTASTASLPPVAAQVEYLRAAARRPAGPARARWPSCGCATTSAACCARAARTWRGNCWRENLVDELFLSLSPLLAGGEPMAGEALRILAGIELDPPVALELTGMLREGSWLFLRYRVASEERV